MTTFQISAAALAAVLPHLSDPKEKTRPILEGFACLAGGLLAGTDGHTAALYQNGHGAQEEIILRPDKRLLALVKRAIKSKSAVRTLTVTVENTMARIEWLGETVSADVVEGPFPNVVQIFPHGEPGGLPKHWIAINPALLARFGDCASLAFYGEERAALVQTPDENFVGLIMPIRAGRNGVDRTDRGTVPEWVRNPTPALATATA